PTLRVGMPSATLRVVRSEEAAERPRLHWARIASAWPAPVTTRTRPGGTNGAIRATVCWSIVRSPTRFSSCLGRLRRLLGQNRVPLPPAMMTAWSMEGDPLRGTLARVGPRSFSDEGQGPIQDLIGQIHAGLAQLFQDGAGRRDQPELFR